MSRIPGLRRVFRFPRRTPQIVDADIEEELRFHLDMRAAELVARRGLDADAARDEALRQFGDIEDARRYIRSMDRRSEAASRRRNFVGTVRQDLMHSGRTLRRSPGFATVVVLALALGIGATTAIFTMVNAILLRPLPVPHPEQLVGFGDPSLVRTVSSGFPRSDLFSYPLYTDLRSRTRLVPALFAAGASIGLDVVVQNAPGTPAEPEHPRGRLVSGNYFDVLGVRAARGRTLLPADDQGPGTGPVAVISDEYWERRFGRDPTVIGRTLLVNRIPLTVVGVAPVGFFGEVVGSPTDLWIPLTMQPLLMPNQDWLRDRNTNWLLLMGRLPPGATPAQAAAEFSALARPVLEEAVGLAPPPDAPKPWIEAYSAARGFSLLRREAGSALIIFMTLAGLVLLVVAANVANLLLARAASRRTEIGVRLALGASRSRVVRQLLAESVLLGVAAGALALLVLAGARTLLLRQVQRQGGPVNLDLSLDAPVLVFAAVLSLLTAVLLGLLPALRATRVDVGVALRSHARGLSGDPLRGGGRRLGLGRWLVVGQVAISLVLLAGAGLLVRSAQNLEQTDVGAARDELLVVTVDAQTAGYAGARLNTLYAQIAARLQQIPGVQGVTFSQNGILTGTESTATFQVPGFVARSDADTTANFDQVGPGYFRTIGARLLRGRDIEARDDANAPRVAVINQTMARFYFGDRDPVGQYLHLDTARHEIIGVASDVTSRSLRAPPSRRFYTPLAQGGAGVVVFEIRTAGTPARAAAATRREILSVDGSLRVLDPQPLSELVRRSATGERWVARLAGVAGGLALALAALGLYGVMTYTIVRRTSEFGLRIALGARPSDVTRMVLRETMTLLLLGIAIGVPAVVGAARLLRNQLVGVGVVDVPSLAAAVVILAGVAALAGYRPASRASGVAPHIALTGQ